jgi:hypothetical protein
MTLADSLNLLISFLGALLIPVVLFFLGQRFIRAKEQSDSALRDAAQLGVFVEHLAGESKERKKLALLALMHMRNAGLFPEALLQAVESIAAGNDPEIAAAARLALGGTVMRGDLTADQRALLFELLLPMKIHFERSRAAFDRWVQRRPAKPALVIEDAIKASKPVIRNLLEAKWYLVPSDLWGDALLLIEHYDAWAAEYDRLRPGGVRDPKEPYVFVGTKGIPFPVAAQDHFMELYDRLIADDRAAATGPGPAHRADTERAS